MVLAVGINEAAESLGVSRASIERAIRRGDIEAAKLGRRVLVKRDSLENLLTRKPEKVDAANEK